MLYPTINDLTKGEYNRYELALATAKCARIVTSEYTRQREAAERSMTGNKDTDRPLISMIDAEYRDEKAVKTAVTRLSDGQYKIVRMTPEEMAEEEARLAALAVSEPIYSEIPDMLPDDLEDAIAATASEDEATVAEDVAEDAAEDVAEDATKETAAEEAPADENV
ncbi:MAG: hypothetical protein IKC26_02320 [Clostridia bacterium]|nr:hypothetical protein [Clostridia bacterium]